MCRIHSISFGKTKAFQALRSQSCGGLEAEVSLWPEGTAKRWVCLGKRGQLVPAGNLCPLLRRKAKGHLGSYKVEPARNTSQILRWLYCKN